MRASIPETAPLKIAAISTTAVASGTTAAAASADASPPRLRGRVPQWICMQPLCSRHLALTVVDAIAAALKLEGRTTIIPLIWHVQLL